MVADGMSFAEILEAYPHLVEGNVPVALGCAARAVGSHPVESDDG